MNRFKIGQTVVFGLKTYKVLGYAATKDERGIPFVEIAWDDYELSPNSGYLAVGEILLKDMEQCLDAFDLIDLLKTEFPGLVNGETEVNGADLVEYLTNAIREIKNV